MIIMWLLFVVYLFIIGTLFIACAIKIWNTISNKQKERNAKYQNFEGASNDNLKTVPYFDKIAICLSFILFVIGGLVLWFLKT